MSGSVGSDDMAMQKQRKRSVAIQQPCKAQSRRMEAIVRRYPPWWKHYPWKSVFKPTKFPKIK